MSSSEPPKSSEIANPDILIAVRTLVTGGFILEDTVRNPGYALLRAYRSDEFGAHHRYCFALAEDSLTSAQVRAADIYSKKHKGQLVLIGASNAEIPKVSWQRFINLFGGPILSRDPLDPIFIDELIKLGHNQLPDGLQGEPNDLFEIYVKTSLEFLLGGRVFRYGQNRRFEARADGIILPSLNFSALYDAKAYAEGYVISTDSIRQFHSYVKGGKRNKHGTPLAGIKILGKTGGDEVLNWIKKNLKKREKVK